MMVAAGLDHHMPDDAGCSAAQLAAAEVRGGPRRSGGRGRWEGGAGGGDAEVGWTEGGEAGWMIGRLSLRVIVVARRRAVAAETVETAVNAAAAPS